MVKLTRRIKKTKTKQFGLSQESYDTALNSIKDFLSTEGTWTKNNQQILVDMNQLAELTDKDYIQLFNHLFNPVISLPNGLAVKNEYTKTYKSTLLEHFSKSHVNLDFIKTSGNALHLNQTEDSNNAAQVLSFSKITNRNNKNKIKFYNKLKIDKDVSSTYQFYQSISDSFTENHQIHYKNKNTQTKIESITTYDEILKTLVKPDISESITRYIFNIIKNEESDVILSNEYKAYAEQLTHLIFITEMERDKTTLFTAPMFLELIKKGEVNKKYFPTSMELAVPALRGVIKKFKELLPNTHTLDYDEENVNLKLADNLLIDIGNELIQWMKKVEDNQNLEEIALIFDFIYTYTTNIKQIEIATIFSISKLIEQYNNLKGGLGNLVQIEIRLIEEINLAGNINAGILQEVEVKSNRSDLLILDKAELKFNTSKTLPISKLENALLAFINTNQSLTSNQKKDIELIIKNVQKYVEVFFNFTKVMNDEVIDDLNKKMPEILRTNFEPIIKTLSVKIKEWYSIDIDLVQLLKAAGEKKNEFDHDKHEMIVEQLGIEIKDPFNQTNTGLSIFSNKKYEPKVDTFKEATFKGELKGKLKTLLKLDINKLKRYFKSNDEESELKEDFSLLNKKRYLKQLDKEQKWGESELEKFDFIKKQVKINPGHKYDQICNDLELAGDNIDLGYESDYSTWSHL